MKANLLLISILLIQTISLSQSIEKNSYYSDTLGNYFHFQLDKVSFHRISGEWLGIWHNYGTGTYIIKKNRIIINTGSYNWETIINPVFVENPTTSNSIIISLKDKETNKPIPFANVWYKNEKDNEIRGGVQTDYNGIAKLFIDKMPIDSFIYILGIDYKITRIPIRSIEGNFEVFMEKGFIRFVENRKTKNYYVKENDTLTILYRTKTRQEFIKKKKGKIEYGRWDIRLIKQN
jgi:hypothetical protein